MTATIKNVRIQVKQRDFILFHSPAIYPHLRFGLHSYHVLLARVHDPYTPVGIFFFSLSSEERESVESRDAGVLTGLKPRWGGADIAFYVCVQDARGDTGATAQRQRWI